MPQPPPSLAPTTSQLDALEARLDAEVPGGIEFEGVLSPPPRLTARMRAALLRKNSINTSSAASAPRLRAFSHPSFAATAVASGVVAFGELAAAGKAAREREEREREREAREAASRPKRGGGSSARK